MDPGRWRRAFAVFQATIARDADERPAFLDDACLGDEGIREAVEQLVAAHESAGDFLEKPAAVRLQILDPPDQTPAPGAPPTHSRRGASLPGRSVSPSCGPSARAAWALSTKCTTGPATRSSH